MHNCPNIGVGLHVFGLKNSGSCSICTNTFESYKQKYLTDWGTDYYRRIWEFYVDSIEVNEEEVHRAISDIATWLDPQECRKHECVENRAEIERHHTDFARISSITHETLSRTLYYSGDTMHLLRGALEQIRGIVG